jgi:DNA modification methylase
LCSQEIVSGDGRAGMTWEIRQGDCRFLMAEMDEASVDAIVTDPPYGLEFMGKDWDAPWKRGDGINADAGFSEINLADGAKRLPAPSYTGSANPSCLNCGGNLRGRRDGTALRKVCTCEHPLFPNPRAVEMAAFQRWGTGWARDALRVAKPGSYLVAFGGARTHHRLICAIEDAGWMVQDCLVWLHGQGFPKGHAQLKPAWEPICLARKPGGKAALNIDGCRIGNEGGYEFAGPREGADRSSVVAFGDGLNGKSTRRVDGLGRWPANVVLDEEAAAQLDEMSVERVSGANLTRRGSDKFRGVYSGFSGQRDCEARRGIDIGGASRFFYAAKASTAEREGASGERNKHPTVKPLALMRWLCRLVTPKGGLILDPFVGSATTVQAGLLEGFRVIGMETDPATVAFARKRVAGPLFAEEHLP